MALPNGLFGKVVTDFLSNQIFISAGRSHMFWSCPSAPIPEPLESEREGYVLNVLFTCGGLKITDKIYLPYAASDQYCTIAIVDTDALIR